MIKKNSHEEIRPYGSDLLTDIVPVSWLTSSPDYPKKWDKKTLATIKQEIKSTRQIPPVIISLCTGYPCTYTVLAGWCRVRAVAELGYQWIPVIKLDMEDAKLRSEVQAAFERHPSEWDPRVIAEFSKLLFNEMWICGDSGWIDYLKRARANRRRLSKQINERHQ